MSTASPKRSIFRSKTVQKYIQNREKSVLPRLIAPPVFAFFWIVLVLLIAAGIVVWFAQVPVYISGEGVVLQPSSPADQQATAAIILPASEASHLRAGLPVQIHIGQAGPVLNFKIDNVNLNLLSPDDVHQQFGLAVTDPSLVVSVGLGSAVPASLYAGSLVQAQIQIGTESLLSLFPLLNNL